MTAALARPVQGDEPVDRAANLPQRPLVRALGRREYVPTWEAMRDFTARRDAGTADELWVVEHPPVYTLGQAGRREHLHAVAGSARPPATGHGAPITAVPVVASDRGGQVTYHGPGQVVVYVLVDLRRLGIYVKELVYRLETGVLQTLADCGVDGRRVAGAPGVFVPLPGASHGTEFAGLAKIAALGIKVARGCSYHGVALNVAMDLAPFAAIDPCGYAALSTVDLATLGVAADFDTVAAHLVARLGAHFETRN